MLTQTTQQLTLCCTKLIMKVKNDHRSKFSNLSSWKEEAWKKIRAPVGFEPMTSAIPVRCSTNWAMKPHIFRLLLSNCLNWKIYCDDHSSLSSTTTVQIWIISYLLHNVEHQSKFPLTQDSCSKRPLRWLICFINFKLTIAISVFIALSHLLKKVETSWPPRRKNNRNIGSTPF